MCVLTRTDMPRLHVMDQGTPEHIQLHGNNLLQATITGTQYKAYLVANLALKDAPQAAADHYRIPLEIVLSAMAFYDDAFINEADVAKSTRQNRLSHMRKLLDLLAVEDSGYRQHHEAVKSFLKVTVSEDDKARTGRQKRALTNNELSRFLDVWRYDTSNTGLRNNAMMRLLVYTGLRRSELVALTWRDIDMSEMIITVRHGKGDKERTVAIVDHSPVTKMALLTLAEAQGAVYRYIFPRMTAGRNALFAQDKPVFDQKVALIVNNTARKAGIGHLAPHDLRRTHITIALNGGATVADMQAQAGHVNAAMTLLYAQGHDAQERRRRISFPVV